MTREPSLTQVVGSREEKWKPRISRRAGPSDVGRPSLQIINLGLPKIENLGTPSSRARREIGL